MKDALPEVERQADAAVLEAKIEAVWLWADSVADGVLERAELDRLAAAIDSRGRVAFVAIYSGLFVNVPRDEVVVYVTDTHRGAALIREREHGTIELAFYGDST